MSHVTQHKTLQVEGTPESACYRSSAARGRRARASPARGLLAAAGRHRPRAGRPGPPHQRGGDRKMPPAGGSGLWDEWCHPVHHRPRQSRADHDGGGRDGSRRVARSVRRPELSSWPATKRSSSASWCEAPRGRAVQDEGRHGMTGLSPTLRGMSAAKFDESEAVARANALAQALVGQSLGQLRVGVADAQLQFAMASLSLWAPIRLASAADGGVYPFGLDGLAVLLPLLNGDVTAVVIGMGGGLSLSIDGITVTCDSDPAYEAWCYNGSGGEVIACTPGGDLTTWSPSQ